jgi:putative transposase
MSRQRRIIPDGSVHHVINRGNRRATIFFKKPDYEAFLTILADGLEKFAIRVVAFCLMPNHWHLVVFADVGVELSAYMGWVTSTHVRRYQKAHDVVGSGHLYQGRYRNFLVQNDTHLLNVLRYVEANALRAGLVSRAEEWEFSSLARSSSADGRQLLSPSPVLRPPGWVELVNHPEPCVEQLRSAVRRGHPFGDESFLKCAVQQYALQHTVRRTGRTGAYTRGWDSHRLSVEADNW